MAWQELQTDTLNTSEPISESATASAYEAEMSGYEFCRQSGVLGFWDDEPDLYGAE